MLLFVVMVSMCKRLMLLGDQRYTWHWWHHISITTHVEIWWPLLPQPHYSRHVDIPSPNTAKLPFILFAILYENKAYIAWQVKISLLLRSRLNWTPFNDHVLGYPWIRTVIPKDGSDQLLWFLTKSHPVLQFINSEYRHVLSRDLLASLYSILRVGESQRYACIFHHIDSELLDFIFKDTLKCSALLGLWYANAFRYFLYTSIRLLDYWLQCSNVTPQNHKFIY